MEKLTRAGNTGRVRDAKEYPMYTGTADVPLPRVPVGEPISPNSLPHDLISKFRRGTPRSRDGCGTCKARHVKCDEAKPHCNKCLKTGRNCYYVAAQPKNSTPEATPKTPSQGVKQAMTPYQPSVDITGSSAERRSFHFIQAKNLTETFGRCEIDLWDSTMLLYSHHSPAVRTSLLALSAIFEAYETNVLTKDEMVIQPGILHKYAFAQYAKAVTEVLQSLNSNGNQHGNNQKAVLLCCLIFIWVEIMLGNTETAKSHLDSGVKIINDIAAKPDWDIEREDPDDLYGALHRSFLRLKYQTTVGLDGWPRKYDCTTEDAPPTADPRENMQTPDSRAPFPINEGTKAAQGPNVELTWTLQGRRRQLDRLSKADEIIRRKPSHAIREEEHRRSLAFVYLKLSRAMLSLLTEARSQGRGNIEDYSYMEVIDIIEDIYRRKKLMQFTPVSLDFGVNPPLFFTLKWCNNAQIKRRAYKLLKTGSWQEGLWSRDYIITTVEQQDFL